MAKAMPGPNTFRPVNNSMKHGVIYQLLYSTGARLSAIFEGFFLIDPIVQRQMQQEIVSIVVPNQGLQIIFQDIHAFFAVHFNLFLVSVFRIHMSGGRTNFALCQGKSIPRYCFQIRTPGCRPANPALLSS